MPYIGRELDSGNYLKLDDISSSFNGSTTTFNLTAGGKAFFPGSAFSILVSLAGVTQEPEAAYQINNATITFATAPLAGDQFFCIVLGLAHGVNTPANGTVDGAKLAKPFNYDGYFYLDDTNNRVGVGTATPSKTLHVVGEGQFDSVRVLGDLQVDGTTTTLDTVVTEVDRLEVGANNNTVAIAVTQSGSGDAAIFIGGDVGIGTNNPNKLLHVHNSSSNAVAARFTSSNSSLTGGLLVGWNGTVGQTYLVENADYRIGTNNAERLRITSDGNIGIGGLTTPGALLSIPAGESNTPRFAIESAVDDNDFTITQYEDGNGTYTMLGQNVKLNSGGNNTILDSGHKTAGILLDARNHGAITFLTGGTNAVSEPVKITSAGSVGIGTNTPQSQFEVYGSSPIVRSKHSTSQKYTQINHDGTDGYLDWSSGDLILRGASNTERLRINSAGETILRINSASHQTFRFTTQGSNEAKLIMRDASDNEHIVLNTAGISHFNGGNFVIGGTTANSRLDVHGGDGITITNSGDTFLQNKTTGTTGTNYLEFKDSGGGSGAIFYQHNGDNLCFKVAGLERLRINSDGKVLIADDALVQNNFWGDNIKLQVTDNTASVINSVTYSVYNGGLDIMRARGSASSPSIVLNNDKLGDVSFYGYNSNDSDANDRFQRAAAITAEVDGTPGNNDDSVPGRLIFSTGTTTTGQPVERLRITSDGKLCVGINTAFGTENENVNIASSGGGRIALLRNDTSIGSGNELGRITWYSNDSTTTTYQQCAAIRAIAAGGFADGDKPTDLVFLNTPDNSSTPAETLRMTSAGNVGIGTDNPDKKFRVEGDARITGTLTMGTSSTSINGLVEYPSIRPVLDLNFAVVKTLDSRISFTRTSIGTFTGEDGLVKYASHNTPRFDHDPTTGESLGLLIEESRTNILGLSSDLTDNNGTDWDAVNGTIAVNQTTAPDGTTTAASFTASAGNAEHSVVFAELVPTGNVTVSVWVKTNTYSIVSFVLYGEANSTVSYNLSTKTVYNQGSNVSRATITEYPNGWYRISATMNTSSNQRAYRLYASTGNFNAGGSESFYYWGPQVESGSFETSYIPTYVSNTSVTRAQDTPLITGTNFTDFYDETEGTLVLSSDIGYLATANQAAVVFEDTSNVSSSFIAMGYNTGGGGSGHVSAWYNSSGTTSAFKTHNIGITINTEFRQAFAYKLNDFASVVNGGTPLTDNSGALTSLIDRVRFGNYHYDGMTSGHIRQFKYYNKRLSNAELQGLTQQ